MVFKKDITPFAKGGSVTKHKGKSAGERKPNLLGRLTNRYPKATPPTSTPVNQGMTPPFGIGQPPEEV